MARTAVAYSRLPSGRTLDPDATASLEVVAVVVDEDPDRHGLTRALALIASGGASTLVVDRLREVAGSLGELARLLEWLHAAGGNLVAADVGLDTATPAGRDVARVVAEIDRWAREPDHPRRPRGRPGLGADSPALAQRIAAMRERGLSLQAIADTLNDDGVPTPRGGAAWRPSSVQSALGYRRPHPPAPGAPPLRPPGAGPGPGRGGGPGPPPPGRRRAGRPEP